MTLISSHTLIRAFTDDYDEMQFEPNVIYHIYNQGNNRQVVFHKREHYLFFLRKMRSYLLPYGDLLAYCLMPNHFHWLLYVHQTEKSLQELSDEKFRP